MQEPNHIILLSIEVMKVNWNHEDNWISSMSWVTWSKPAKKTIRCGDLVLCYRAKHLRSLEESCTFLMMSFSGKAVTPALLNVKTLVQETCPRI